MMFWKMVMANGLGQSDYRAVNESDGEIHTLGWAGSEAVCCNTPGHDEAETAKLAMYLFLLFEQRLQI